MWLYIPPQHLPPATSSASAPGSADLNSESCSPLMPWERLAEASATWRGKPLLPAAWSRQWKRGGFITRLSGLICSPSMLDHGAASFISSLRAIPARTTALPESAPGPMATASSPPRSAALPKSAGLILSSVRTCRGTQTDSSAPSSRHWKGWATALRQEYSARPKPAIPCGASDCSSWLSTKVSRGGYEVQRDGSLTLEGAAAEWMAPVADDTGMRTKKYGQGGTALSMQAGDWAAPQARDHFPAHTPEYVAAKKAEGHGMRNLNDEAATWRAPSDISKRGGSQPMEKRAAGGHSVNLEDQAEHWKSPGAGSPNSLRGSGQDPAIRAAKGHQVNLQDQASAWPTPATRDHKGSSEGSILRKDGKSRADMLDFAAEQFFTLPPSSPAPPTDAGPICSIDSPNTNQPSVRRKLNPIFVEALIRWPTGLSGFARPETAWTRWWQLMPSYLSALCSQGSEGPEQGSLF